MPEKTMEYFDGIKILRQRKPSALYMMKKSGHVSIDRNDTGTYTVSVCGQPVMTTHSSDEYMVISSRASRAPHFFQTINLILNSMGTGMYLKWTPSRKDWVLATGDTSGQSSYRR